MTVIKAMKPLYFRQVIITMGIASNYRANFVRNDFLNAMTYSVSKKHGLIEVESFNANIKAACAFVLRPGLTEPENQRRSTNDCLSFCMHNVAFSQTKPHYTIYFVERPPMKMPGPFECIAG